MRFRARKGSAALKTASAPICHSVVITLVDTGVNRDSERIPHRLRRGMRANGR